MPSHTRFGPRSPSVGLISAQVSRCRRAVVDAPQPRAGHRSCPWPPASDGQPACRSCWPHIDCDAMAKASRSAAARIMHREGSPGLGANASPPCSWRLSPEPCQPVCDRVMTTQWASSGASQGASGRGDAVPSRSGEAFLAATGGARANARGERAKDVQSSKSCPARGSAVGDTTVVKKLPPLAAALAWILLQVPLVVCQSECETSVTFAMMGVEHSCHAETSEVHQERCCGTHGDAEAEAHPDPTHPADPTNPDDRPGEHSLVQIPMVVSGDVVAMPSPGATELAAPTCLGRGAGCPDALGGLRARDWGDPAPADRLDPVARAVALLI